MRRIIMVAALGVLYGLASAAPAFGSTHPAGATRIDHLDITKQQQIESMVVLPSGGVDATFLFAGQVARIAPDGTVTTLASFPAPPPGGRSFVSGLTRSHSGTLYALYVAGSADLNGVWRISPGHKPERIVAMPANAALNGLTLDPAERFLYFTDSAAGRIYRAPVSGGAAVGWAQSPELAPVTFLGANGVHVREGAVWVSSTDHGLLLRIPIERSGAAGPVTVVARDLVGIDDFTFDRHGVIAAMNAPNLVVEIAADGSHRVILAAADGLENPTCVALHAGLLYIASGAYHTMTDPNLMITADAPLGHVGSWR
jgi:hypothetical protein